MSAKQIDRVRDTASRVRDTASQVTPADQLAAAVRKTVELTVGRALSSLEGKVTGAAGKLGTYAEGGAGNLLSAAVGGGGRGRAKGLVPKALKAAVSGVPEKLKEAPEKLKEAVGGLGGGGRTDGREFKATTIVEEIDVGVPIDLAYDQWTRFTDFPSFMKKVESVEQESDEKLTWKAQILWSHRTWESTIVEQVPDERIVWKSKGDKGYVDGAVTFHDLAPDLTRIILVLEYHPQGLFERTGNLWRAQGRRARLELQHFQRHVMTQSILHPDEVEGWRGEIHDGEVVDDSAAEEEAEQEEAEQEEAEQEEAEQDEAEQDEDVDEEPPPAGEAKEDDEAEEDEDKPRRAKATSKGRGR